MEVADRTRWALCDIEIASLKVRLFTMIVSVCDKQAQKINVLFLYGLSIAIGTEWRNH